MSHIPFWVTVTLTSDLVLRIFVFGAYVIFFEVGIPNLECICILGWWSLTYYFLATVTLGWWSLTYYFLATVTLTSDLVLIIIVSGAYLLYYLRRESQIWCVNASVVSMIDYN